MTAYPDTGLFINGAWRGAAEGRTIGVFNPATGEVIGQVAHASRADLDDAVAAAVSGFAIWREKTAAARAVIMREAAARIRARADEIGRLITLEQGKPLAEAKGELNAACDILDWFADEGLRVYGRLVPSRYDPAVRQMVVRDPIGPVAAFTPWNFPLNQIIRKIGPALACGCSVVLKAPEETPASPAALVNAFTEAGLPAGVLNLVFGEPAEISSHLIAHRAIRSVTFTGSTAVGKLLASMAGKHMKRVSMELGGHAPVIVCGDADIDLALSTAGRAKFRNAGQVCISPTRFLVHADAYDAFVEGAGKLAAGIQVGDGLAEGTHMGPLANPRRLTAMEELTADALEHDAQLVAGGERIGNAGNFWKPSVLANVSLTSRLFNEEPFGPIMGIHRFTDLDDAIAEANRLDYGLAAYAYTRSLAEAEKLSRGVEVGMMWINMPSQGSAELPFGGIKDSGYGTEGGPEAMDPYLNLRTVAVRAG